MSDKAKVKMIPICECGYIFRKGTEIKSELEKADNGVMYKKYKFNPKTCPQCGKAIGEVETEY